MRFMDFPECRHAWQPIGEPFKTFARADESADNPRRQSHKCRMCGDIKVEVLPRLSQPGAGQQ